MGRGGRPVPEWLGLPGSFALQVAGLGDSGPSEEVGAELNEWETKSGGEAVFGGRVMVRSFCVRVLTPARRWLLVMLAVEDESVRKIGSVVRRIEVSKYY